MRHALRFTFAIGGAVVSAMCLIWPAAAFAQLPQAATFLPAGFTVTVERAIGPTTIVEATRPNENVPKPHQDNGIRVSITGTGTPGASRRVAMLAAQAEDPARQLPGSVSREEPCGRKGHQNGVLTCRKIITPWVGSGRAPDLVTFNVSWLGPWQDGTIAINVAGFFGAKEAATGLIDSIIAKIMPKK